MYVPTSPFVLLCTRFHQSLPLSVICYSTLQAVNVLPVCVVFNIVQDGSVCLSVSCSNYSRWQCLPVYVIFDIIYVCFSVCVITSIIRDGDVCLSVSCFDISLLLSLVSYSTPYNMTVFTSLCPIQHHTI